MISIDFTTIAQAFNPTEKKKKLTDNEEGTMKDLQSQKHPSIVEEWVPQLFTKFYCSGYNVKLSHSLLKYAACNKKTLFSTNPTAGC